MMYYVIYVSKALEKYMIKMSSINLSYSKELQILLTSSKMACSGLITCTAKWYFSKLLGIVTKVPDLEWISYRYTYRITG